ncbi:hypothetical protein BJX64DRAFT_289053 [Aspergillus heterothallicus]
MSECWRVLRLTFGGKAASRASPLVNLPTELLLLIMAELQLIDQAAFALTCKSIKLIFGDVLEHEIFRFPRLYQLRMPELQPEFGLTRRQLLQRIARDNEGIAYCEKCQKIHRQISFYLETPYFSGPPSWRDYCDKHAGIADLCPCVSMTLLDKRVLQKWLRLTEKGKVGILRGWMARSFEPVTTVLGAPGLFHRCELRINKDTQVFAVFESTVYISSDDMLMASTECTVMRQDHRMTYYPFSGLPDNLYNAVSTAMDFDLEALCGPVASESEQDQEQGINQQGEFVAFGPLVAKRCLGACHYSADKLWEMQCRAQSNEFSDVQRSAQGRDLDQDFADSNVANVYLDYPAAVAANIGAHVFNYGDCGSSRSGDAYDTLAQVSADAAPGIHSRLVWVILEDTPSGGCISAWGGAGDFLLGRSAAINLEQVHKNTLGKRDRIAMNNESGIDAEGPWFNGVALLRNKEIGLVDVEKAKKKSIGIIGGGISGLMTHFLLRSVGFTNLEISESTGRVGGRIRTEYFDPDPSKYQYQEMGAMRIPLTATFPLGNETLTLNFSNHEIVFHLAEELNKANEQAEKWAINWIPFLQTSDNALSLLGDKRNPDGSIPTIGDVARNASLGAETLHTKALDALKAKINEVEFDPDMMRLIAENIYEAHKKFMGDDWSQTGYVHNVLGFDLNTTDLAGELPSIAAPYWVNLYDNLFFSSKEWKTIDKGMSRLPNAFKPQVGDDLKYHRKIQRIDYLEEEKKVQVSWKNNYTDCHFQEQTYDYTFVAAPFTVVRKMKLPKLSPTLTNAIAGLGYQSACKMALEFHTRFWEHTARPIFGSCNTVTDIPGLGDICYPGFNVNSSGPAVALGSYNHDDYGERWVSTPEEEHAQYVLDALVQLHGDVAREQYTGRFKRLCWLEEESNAGGSWALPSVGQHKLYIPAYFGTEKNMIFIGEHTSYTHSWIASALESAVRGSVQLLLELGLVDEAKQITREWMGRWITV